MQSIDDLPPPPSALPPPTSGIDDLPPPPGPSWGSDLARGAIADLPAIGGMVGGILGTPADMIAGPMGNVAGAAAGGYLGTAAKNLINKYYDPASAPKTTAEALTSPVTGGVEQGLMQGAGEGVAPYVAKGLSAAGDALSSGAKWVGTKALSNLGGVAPDTIKEYAQFSDRINSAPSIEKLKEISDEFVGKLSSDVDAGKVTADQAQEAYKSHLSDLKDAYKTAGYDARDAVTSAQQTLKDAHNARIQGLSSDVYDSVNQLKSDVQTGSAQALKTLDKSGAMIDLSPTYSQIDSSIAANQKLGTDDSLAVADKLQAYKERLMSQNWAQIPALDAKRLIQGLDQTTTYSPMAGSFDKAKNAAFKGVRSALDQSVKAAVPEYAQAMEPVAANADLLGRVQDFGDKQTGAGILQRINAPNQLERKAALTELGQKYGTDFVAGADPGNLPEAAQLQKAQAIQDALRPDRVAENVDQTMGASRQRAAVDTAQSNLAQAQEKLAPFKSLAEMTDGQTQTQQKLASLGKGGNIELADMFQRLGKLTDTDFVQAMKDQNTLAAFKRGAMNGSRNTLMGALTGFAFGGFGGIATGGLAGRAVDQFGPVVTKKILDGAISVAKNPTVSAIANLEIPEAAKKSMAVGLQNYLAGGRGGMPAQAVAQNQGQPNRSPAKGPDSWAQQGVQKLGIQDPAYMQKLMQDPKAKQLLIQASDLAPGSKAMKNIVNQIQRGWGSR